MHMMERLAVDLYHAETITLDTASYFCYRDPTDSYYIEDKTRRGKTCYWYEAQGYKPIRVGPLGYPMDHRRVWLALTDCAGSHALVRRPSYPGRPEPKVVGHVVQQTS